MFLFEALLGLLAMPVFLMNLRVAGADLPPVDNH